MRGFLPNLQRQPIWFFWLALLVFTFPAVQSVAAEPCPVLEITGAEATCALAQNCYRIEMSCTRKDQLCDCLSIVRTSELAEVLPCNEVNATLPWCCHLVNAPTREGAVLPWGARGLDDRVEGSVPIAANEAEAR